MTTASARTPEFPQSSTPTWLDRIDAAPTPLAHKARLSIAGQSSPALRLVTASGPTNDLRVEADQFLERVRAADPAPADPTVPGSATPGPGARQLLSVAEPAPAGQASNAGMLMPALVLFIIVASIVLVLEFSGLLP